MGLTKKKVCFVSLREESSLCKAFGKEDKRLVITSIEGELPGKQRRGRRKRDVLTTSSTGQTGGLKVARDTARTQQRPN